MCEQLVSILGRFCSHYAEVFFMSTRKAVRYSVDIAKDNSFVTIFKEIQPFSKNREGVEIFLN